MKRILLGLSLFTGMHQAHAQSGILDPTFADNAVIKNINFVDLGNEAITDVIADDQDRIWLAGYTLLDNDFQIILARLTPDGAYDVDFNDDGHAIINIAANNVEQVGGIALQSGKLIVAGHKTANGVTNQFAIRFNADGTLDTGFGTLGIADLPFNAAVSAVAIDDTDHIYLSGYADGDVTITKLLPNGSPDNSFSSDGFRTATFASADVSAALAVDDDGIIYVMGSGVSNGFSRAHITSFLPNGNNNMDFAFTGRKSFVWPNDVDFMVQDGLLTEDGSRFYLAGATDDGQLDAAMIAVTLAGEIDTDFGIGGRIEFDGTLGGDELFSSIIEGEDGVYATLILQEVPVGMNSGMAYINHQGVLHSDFGNSGWSTFNILEQGNDQVLDMAFQSDGNIIMIGLSDGEANQFFGYAARVLTGSVVSSTSDQQREVVVVYPNPAVDVISIGGEAFDPTGQVFQIFNAAGQVVLQGRLTNKNEQIRIDALSPGLYQMVVGTKAYARFVKMN